MDPERTPDPIPVAPQPVRLTGKDAFRLHLTLTIGLVVCIGAFAFELSRALGGHTFSWMYVFEWPLFGGFAIYMWWNLLQGHDRVRRPTSKPARPGIPTGARPAAPPDEDLEAWNRYVHSIGADDPPDASSSA